MAYTFCKKMKNIQTTLILVMLCVSGCDSSDPSDTSQTSEVTVKDLMWATDWNIYKWKVGDLTNEKLNRIQVVVVGPDGQVAKEGLNIGSGNDSILDPDMEFSIALKKVDSDAVVKLRTNMGSSSTTFEDVFVGNSWSCGPMKDIYNNLLVFATSSASSGFGSKSILAEDCNKLCLKLSPYTEQEAEQAASSNP
jgi:hypothetical protein